MLVIISDLHLGDGTCENSIEPSAFRLFTARLEEEAYNASWRADGKYRPLQEINILWLGDILDPLHSTRWLDTKYGDEDYTRPWTDTTAPNFVRKVQEITRAILKKNRHAIDSIYNMTENGAILLPPAIGNGQPDPTSKKKIAVKVNIHYMIGNHDWVYHLPGEEFDEIREEIINAFGLSCDKKPFPHSIEESSDLTALLAPYKVYARHGDIFNPFNYAKEKGRDASPLGDMFALEFVVRLSTEVARQLNDVLPKTLHENLREISNIRPILASPLWAIGQVTTNNLSSSLQNRIKGIWNKVVDDYLFLQKKYHPDRLFQATPQKAIRIFLLAFKNTPLSINIKITLWLYENFWKEDDYSLSKYALKEKAFLEKKANYIVYGHAHDYEIVPLDIASTSLQGKSQLYFNSGTWRAFYALARYKPEAKHFVPYETLSYLTFFKEDQREGKHFETWSGASQ